MKPVLAAIAALTLLGGGLASCQTATPYQARVPGAHVGGYSEQRLDRTHWRVRFSGNSATSREVVEKYLLYRAAELTLGQGADWFKANDTVTERKSRSYLEADPFYDSDFGRAYGWGWRPGWRYYRPDGGWRAWDPALAESPWNGRYELREVSRYVATVDIVMGQGAKPDAWRVLDAREVIANLEPSVARPKD